MSTTKPCKLPVAQKKTYFNKGTGKNGQLNLDGPQIRYSPVCCEDPEYFISGLLIWKQNP